MDSEKKDLLIKTYRQFIEIGLGMGDPGLLQQIADEKIAGFGTAIDEKPRGIKEVIQFIENKKAQSKSFDISWRIVPIALYTTGHEDTKVLADDMYVTIKVGDETFDMYVRISVVLHYVDGQWKVIHWHASKPEQVESQKDTWGVEIWKQKAEELKQLVEEKTADLLHKNRELQIEAALEKVRTVAMGMKSPEDMLSICKTIAQQLEVLGLENIRNVQTAIFYPDRGTYMNYEYYAKHDKTFVTEVDYKNHQIHLAFARKMMKGPGEEVREHLKGRELHEWYAYQQTTNQFVDKFIPDAESLNYYWFSLGPVALGISTYAPLSPQEIELFKRFLKVFELAYQRYLDIEKALQQAREAQVEAALERVRTRTMAMQSSDELAEVSYVLNKQVVELGIPTRGCAFNIYGEHESTEWFSSLEGTLPAYKTPRENIFLKYYEAGQRGETLLIEAFDRDRIKQHYDYLHSLHLLGDDEAEVEMIRNAMPDSQVDHVAYFRYGYLLFITLAPAPEAHDIFKRFAKEFEQTYTRFLDLKKAEAQAREAKIEMSLEKVRSRTMGMQHSDELKEAAALLFKQVISLGAPAFSCGYNILEKDDLECTAWMGTQDGGINPAFRIPLTEDPNFIRFHESKLNGEDFYVLDMQGEALQAHYRYLRDKAPVFRETFDNIIRSGQALPARQVHHIANFSHGNLMFITMEPAPEFHDIFKRFATVFDQTYTRFLDLKKAETRAREAQIDVAVERVRAKALAMHQSEEIMGVARSLWQELAGLQIQGVIATTIYLMQDDGRVRFFDLTTLEGTEHTGHVMDKYMRLEECPDFLWFQRMFRSKDKYLIVEQHDEELKRSLAWIAQFINEEVAASMTAFFEENNAWHLWHPRVLLEKGIMNIDFIEPPPAETEPTLIKMGAAFDLAYKRFLDLQKAEAQAREAQVETALERVRSRAMAMHSSKELGEVVYELRKQMGLLGQKDLETCVIHLYDESPDYIQAWAGIKTPESGGDILAVSASVPKKGLLIIEEALTAYHANRQDYVLVQEGEKLSQGFSFLEKASPEGFTKLAESVSGNIQELQAYWSFADFQGGSLMMVTRDKPNEDSRNLLRRFSNVFGLAYRRFTDIKKAEAQAREAQIEAALEKIRSRSLAMHRSDELKDVIASVFQRLKELALDFDAAAIQLFKEGSKDWVIWVASPDVISEPLLINFPYDKDLLEHSEFFNTVWNARINGEDIINKTYLFEEKNKYYTYVIKHNPQIPASVAATMLQAPSYTHTVIMEEHSALIADSWYEKTLSVDDYNILKRVAKVFEQAHTRFLDLQKAEAQAREAQVEAALERVRARAMAMQKSQELVEVVHELRTQMGLLGQKELETCVIQLYDESPDYIQSWAGIRAPDSAGSILAASAIVPKKGLQIMEEVLAAYEANRQDYVLVNEGEKLRQWFSFLEKASPESYTRLVESVEGDIGSLTAFWSFADFEGGSLLMVTRDTPDVYSRSLLRRFSNVFGLAYRRFADIKQAETRAREAQIEAALERVRSKTMAMHNSHEVGESVATLFEELVGLGVLVPEDRCGIGIMHSEQRMEAWTAAKTTDGKAELTIGFLDMTLHPLLASAYQGWVDKKEVNQYLLEGEDRIRYYEAMLRQPNYKIRRDHYTGAIRIIHNDFYFKEGCLYVFSERELPPASLVVYTRFAAVFGQTYRRYLDLQKAEAQAREATKQASLDRVRAVIASMRSTEDLELITPLIFKELTTLGIPFIRCGVFIIHEDRQIIDAYLSSPSGTSLGVLHLPFHASELTTEMVESWRNGKIHRQHWSQADFIDWTKQMMDQHQIESSSTYQGADTAPESLDLHFVPFAQGMLYVGSLQALGDQDLELVLALARSFSIAYARYEDFVKLETAKVNIESTLTELKATQAQLIQSEKMASLGELTAGIAHEIQNPLNFVNNFSEINAELSEEILDAAAKGDLEEVKALASDIKSNQEKIREHGKRADSIVKGMLQHSRSSAGTKEPTHISALADEYLRLAYHGMRAKDKSFNASLKTDFEDGIPLVPVVAQDIGRVLLNLFNNAFYAVNERKKTGGDAYEPEVSVRVRKDHTRPDPSIVITITDNGLGIPEPIKAKIFQPFFTTKPTGQGTGLGLSLSYDIIKAHGGEIDVSTQEGNGSTFIIHLPTH